MGFKLVRIDATDSCKVSLTVGSTFVGRGTFLDCNDQRVSRKHAELVVTADSVILKSLHQNPCFVKKKSSKETIIFNQPDSQVLGNGDQFGLIPDSYWYEVIDHFGDSPIDVAEGISTCNEQKGHVDSNNTVAAASVNDGDTQCYNNDDQDKINSPSDSAIDERSESPSLLPPENPSSPTFTLEVIESLFADNFEDEDLTQTNQPVQSIDQRIESTNQPVESINQPIEPTNQPVEPTNQLVESTNQRDESTEESIDSTDLGSNKRSHTQDTIPYDVKRVKTEPQTQDVKVESNEANTVSSNQPVKTEPGSPHDVKPGPSHVQGSSSNDGNSGPAMPPSPVKPPSHPLRERCMYGATCYRKNPQHKATFSHPSDADWGSGAQAPCPWGSACGRRDPRHWRDHSHPSGVQQPPARPPGFNRPDVQLVRRHGNNFYINANSVHFYDDHFQVEDSDGDSVDFDYEF